MLWKIGTRNLQTSTDKLHLLLTQPSLGDIPMGSKVVVSRFSTSYKCKNGKHGPQVTPISMENSLNEASELHKISKIKTLDYLPTSVNDHKVRSHRISQKVKRLNNEERRTWIATVNGLSIKEVKRLELDRIMECAIQLQRALQIAEEGMQQAIVLQAKNIFVKYSSKNVCDL